MGLTQMTSGRTNLLEFKCYFFFKNKRRNKQIKMKKLYIILFVVLTIPVSALAQDAHEHLFPAVTFTYQGVDYTVPAWDALASKGERVQNTFVKTNPDEGGDDNPFGPDNPLPGGGENLDAEDAEKVEYNGILVATACALPAQGLPKGDFSEANIVISGEEYVAADVTYGDIFPEIDSQLASQPLFSKAKITGTDYTVPETATAFSQDVLASKYNIIGIGDAAYANKSWSHTDNTVYMQAKNVTIPSYIKSLGRFSFYADGYTADVTIPQGESEIAVFPEGIFADCMRLKHVRFPESLTRIESHALGGCKVLRLLYMYGENCPDMAADALTKYTGSTATDLNPGMCCGWTYDFMVTIKNYRSKYPEIWNNFIFRVPMTWPESGLSSFYSDMPIWRKYVADSGDDANKLSTQPDTKMKFSYIKQEKNTLLSKNESGNYQLTVTEWTGSTYQNYAPKSMGVLLSGDSEQLYFAPMNYNNIRTFNSYLFGNDEPTNMDNVIANNADQNVYLLKGGQFRRCSGGTLKANKAYLMIPKSIFDGGRTEAKDIDIIYEGETDTDGVQGVVVNNKEIDNNWYTLQGVRVEVPSRGIFIRNGKKYIFD